MDGLQKAPYYRIRARTSKSKQNQYKYIIITQFIDLKVNILKEKEKLKVDRTTEISNINKSKSNNKVIFNLKSSFSSLKILTITKIITTV